MIKKYKNGNITLRAEKSDFDGDGNVKESFYHDDMFMRDLYIENTDDGTCYIIDYNTNKAYLFGSYLMQNPLKLLLDRLKECPMIKLYPLLNEDSLKVTEELREDE